MRPPRRRRGAPAERSIGDAMIQDSDDVYRATAKVGKNEKFELPLALNPALTEVQENPFLLPLILHPLIEFDHDAAQSKRQQL